MTDTDEGSKQVPRIYLDQNVLSLIANGKWDELKEGFVSNEYQLIYSDEHINEILRCGEHSFHQKALNALVEMNGMHLQINDDQSPALSNISPLQLFDQAKNNDGVAVRNINAMQQLIFKFFSGRQGESFTEVLEEQKQACAELLIDLKDKVNELGEEDHEDATTLKQLMPMLSEQAYESICSTIDQLSQQMDKDIADPERFDGPKGLQEYFGVGAEQLNNIEPPGVIGKILDKILAKDNLPEPLQNQEDFLRLCYGVPQAENQPTRSDKIRGLYFFLNFTGYWQDKQRRKWGKFVGGQSDMNHAIYGAYADVLISEDVRFLKKTTAIYEYLGISTKVFQASRKS